MYHKPLAFHAAFPIAVVVTKGLYIILSVRFVICTFIMSLGILAVTVTHFAKISPSPPLIYLLLGTRAAEQQTTFLNL